MMARNRSSAKAAGTRFETAVTAYLRRSLDDDRIERRAKSGAKDRGDIGGVRTRGQRLVIECKNVSRLALPQWVTEAQTEAGHDGALAGIVVHKRHGVGISDSESVGEQYVTMTLADLVAILTGERRGP